MNGSKSATCRLRCQGRVKRMAGKGSLTVQTYPVSEPFTFAWEGPPAKSGTADTGC